MHLTNVKITSNNFNVSKLTASFYEISECPLCKFHIKPHTLFEYIHRTGSFSTEYALSLFHLCPHCNQTFIAKYSQGSYRSSTDSCSFPSLPNCAPCNFKSADFEEFIEKLSPNFVKIYNQALRAESETLDEIAGIGFRKALEFLIKDFLISQNPDKTDSIKNDALGNCINTYIDNPQLKAVASRAVWLGNDQTHYIQKFENKDIGDLKNLIKLTVNWITILYLTDQSINDIEKP